MSDNMTDLEWLARRVHKWTPDDPNHKLRLHKADALNAEGWTFAHCYSCGYSFDEWQSERARLQSKPKWEVAPDWADFLIQNGDGWWCFGEGFERICDPEATGMFFVAGKTTVSLKQGEVLGDWRDTLEHRPEYSLYEVTTSNGDKYMLTDAPEPKKEWRGPEDGLPPVGEIVRSIHHQGHGPVLASYFNHYENQHRVIWDNGDTIYVGTPLEKMRPAITEEDKAVMEMVNIITKTYTDSKSELPSELPHRDSLEVYLREIYRAGYRKRDASE